MRRRISLLLFAFALLFASAPWVSAQEASPVADKSVEVIASGLTNPRGFDWAPDGTLHLALAGHGGDTRIPVIDGFTVQIGLSSSVVTVADGCATPVVAGLVSTLWEEAGWIWGAMDVTFLNDELYVLISGAGPSWLSPSSFSGVYRINGDGTMTLIADITTWLPQNPPSFVPPDYNTDGSLFDLEVAGDTLLLSEAVGGQLLRVTLDGQITQVADLSDQHLVPTGIAVDAEGNAYVGFETTPPYADGSSKVVKVTPDGVVTDHWTGLTTVTDVVFGPDGALYAAEMSTGNPGAEPWFNPSSGRIVRQTGPDSLEPVVTGLPLPVGLGFDPGGRLLFTTPAFGPDAGIGQGMLLAVDPTQAPIAFSNDMIPATAPCA
ncbi:MAG: ScyD/ScyE family protein [Thermomicrobiales bacterium]|nr:ScyD/ScyE family protein [Thermomicrobiales bacterium]